jgi:hypothetical protein
MSQGGMRSMKTEIITPQIKTEIDWSKPQLFKSFNDTIVLSNGKDDIDFFSGTIISSIGKESIGLKSSFMKDEFNPITEPITIKFIPE